MRHGLIIKNIRICDVWLLLYSNGSSEYISNIFTTDKQNKYLGIYCQCVEFVRRYIYKKYNINLADKWNEGNACDWFNNIDCMGLVKVDPKEAQEGDIITFTGGLYGHIGLIIKEGKSLYMVSQNLFNDNRDIKTYLQPEILQNKKSLKANNHYYRFQAVIRVKDFK